MYKATATSLQYGTLCTNDTAHLFLKLHGEAMRQPTGGTENKVSEFLFSVSLLGSYHS